MKKLGMLLMAIAMATKLFFLYRWHCRALGIFRLLSIVHRLLQKKLVPMAFAGRIARW